MSEIISNTLHSCGYDTRAADRTGNKVDCLFILDRPIAFIYLFADRREN